MYAVIPGVLLLLVIALSGPLPWLMARQHMFRRSPLAALVAWQAVTVAAIIAALAAAPAAIPLVTSGDNPNRHPGLLALVGAVSGGMLASLLLSGHRVGRRLRILRARHRELVDIIARHDGQRTRVLAHPTPTAYCLPGRHARVVISQGVLDHLPDEQIQAILAHEEEHLRARHDLLVEFFTVVHLTVPPVLRREEAMREVRLLIEALADRAAVRVAGEMPTARALLTLAGSATPEAALGSAAGASTRLALLAAGKPHPVVTAIMYVYAIALVVAPLTLLAMALSRP